MRVHSHTVGGRAFDALLRVGIGWEHEERYGPPWDPVGDVVILHERGGSAVTGRLVEFDVVEAVEEPGYPRFQLARLRRRA